ncbi:hypothetical protein AeNC1_007483 [Aphanomyces euteiches]|nr:hypothetical protein AeNC1_007483 [Aphanomyces euteiches]
MAAATHFQAEFFHVQCEKSTDLFSGTYVRRYTNQGCNVVRCFPHCCPHTEYRGCGSSISLRLILPSTGNLTTLQAFAAFQPCSVPQMQTGDVVSASIFADRRSASHYKGEWLQGRLDGSTNPTCFHFNEKRTEGWHYGWKGGASAQQRLESHHLCVYVVEPINENPSTFRVVGCACSTPFLLGSYRRAIFAPRRSNRATTRARPPSTPRPSNSEIINALLSYCQSLSICDFQSEWRQLEQNLMAGYQEWFGIEVNHTQLVHFEENHPTSISAHSSGPREAAMRLLAWWAGPPTQYAVYTQFQQLWGDNSSQEIAAAHEMWNDFLAQALIQVNPQVLDSFVRDRGRFLGTHSRRPELNFVTRILQHQMCQVVSPPLEDNSFSGQWVLEPHRSYMSIKASMSLSFLLMSEVLTMALGLRINLVRDALHVQSCIQRLPANPQPLVLDSVPRLLRTLPNGEPGSIIDTNLFVGDYLGWIENRGFLLWFYGWPKNATNVRYVLQVQASMQGKNHLEMICTLESSEIERPIDFEAMTSEERIFRTDTTTLTTALNATLCYRRHVFDINL